MDYITLLVRLHVTNARFYPLFTWLVWPPDTARLFPPTSSKSKLYALLRPEFVKLNPVPLSSDAFSAFGGADNTIHDQEVAQATKRLLDQSIPSFSRYLDERFKEDYAAGDKPSWSCTGSIFVALSFALTQLLLL